MTLSADDSILRLVYQLMNLSIDDSICWWLYPQMTLSSQMTLSADDSICRCLYLLMTLSIDNSICWKFRQLATGPFLVCYPQSFIFPVLKSQLFIYVLPQDLHIWRAVTTRALFFCHDNLATNLVLLFTKLYYKYVQIKADFLKKETPITYRYF